MSPQNAGAAELALELRGITKRFGALTANDAVDLQLRRGEIHALLGENGAGKSTLMSMVYGMARPDEGEILVEGEPVSVDSPRDAMAHGVGMVFQHFMLIPVMTVAENLVLGAEPRRRGLLDIGAARRRTRELSDRYGLKVDPDARVSDVSVGQQQRVEILRALDRGARILVLDEPTAVLTAQETHELAEVLRTLRDAGTSIVFITHKLHEVLEIADRVTVLRRGKTIGTIDTAAADEASLARMMVGRDVVLRVEKEPARPGEPLLEIDDVHAVDDRGLPAVDGVSLQVRAGEIVAVAGIDGNGQSELIDLVAGLRPCTSGHVRLRGKDITNCSPRAAREAGMGHIAEDRHRRGLVLDFNLSENLALMDYRHEARFGLLKPRRMLEAAKRLLGEFDVRGGTPATPARSLSGGNQQKVVIAREISGNPDALIAAQPTRGLDVGAIEFVHRRLLAERDAGRAILLFSLELDEVRSLADRILVIYDGRIVGELPPTASDEDLGLLMTGGGSARVAS
ncbi:MAG TPA: ABC transporter ATP-binding protein [Baekduia sp.]|uniref:ABC transporter ATP-binding protein n=1 Tax=Baekduia sp. TaxID=2600305 RepID=UPI002C14EA56|nr:ABC transporter ATP-binding protein [Baekduia sp.]HMJ35130.1 ABC transporter ATP-binding protein [Baekduia sp.]